MNLMWAIQHQMSLAIYLMNIALGLCQYPQTHNDEVLLLQQAKVKKQTNLEMNQKEKICKTGNLVRLRDKRSDSTENLVEDLGCGHWLHWHYESLLRMGMNMTVSLVQKHIQLCQAPPL
jgi:hypothetical protein